MFSGYRAFVGEDENVFGTDSCDDYTLWRLLIPLNYTLTNSQNDNYYVYFTTITNISKPNTETHKKDYTLR